MRDDVYDGRGEREGFACMGGDFCAGYRGGE
jgi:hypothetical protein